MGSLFKGRYIIAVYDANNDEDLLGVFDNPNDMKEFLQTEYADTIISRYIKTFGTFPIIRCNRYTFYFIDVMEKHNDIFALEDREFLKCYRKSKTSMQEAYCKRNNISRRTYYRHIRIQKDYENTKGGIELWVS